MIFNLIYVPFSFAFVEEINNNPELYLLKFFAEKIWPIIFTFDIAIILNTGYYKND